MVNKIPFSPKIPRANLEFGQRVYVHWKEVECGVTEATITGINYDHRRDGNVTYTVVEDDGSQTDGIPESMLT